MSRLRSFINRVTNLCLGLAAAALAFMVFAQVWEIIARYFFSAPTKWVNDTVNYLLLVSVFLALPKVTEERGHVTIDFLIASLSSRFQRIVGLGLAAGGAIACFVAAGAAFSEVSKQASWGVQTVASFSVPKALLTKIIALRFLLSAGHFALYAVNEKVVAKVGGI